MTVQLQKAKRFMCGGWRGMRDNACEKREEKRYKRALKKLSYYKRAVQRFNSIYYLSYAIPVDDCTRGKPHVRGWYSSETVERIARCISHYEKNKRVIPIWDYVNKRQIINWMYERSTKNGQTKRRNRDRFIDYLVKISR
jgi:hypothetical protein